MRYVSSKTVGRALGAALLIGALGACDFIEPVTTDPNAVPQATIDQLFTGIQVNTWFFAEGQLSRLSSLWTQQMTGTDRQFTALDGYLFNEQDTDGEFQALYTGGGLVDLALAIDQAESAGRNAYAGILKIHEAYLFGMGASLWGDIPYSEANDVEITSPALDDQADVYASVQALLSEAISDLTTGGDPIPVPAGTDMSLGGDADAWIAVAHTLKARYYMHWAEVNGTSAYTSALSEANQGIMSASGNWEAVHTTTATENNGWYQFLRDRAGYISSGDYLLPAMREDSDPRLSIYFSAGSGGTYVSPEEAGGGAAASGMNETDGRGAPEAEFPMVSCAENYFIIAEAELQAGSGAAAAIAAAKNALGCQEDYYGVDLTAQKAAFDGLSGTDLLEEIMMQKYTALFLNIESWNDYKRTCLPEITPRVSQGVPARLYYGLTERQTNPNVPEPADQAGGHGFRAGHNDNDPAGCG
jgi:hypothetical protein